MNSLLWLLLPVAAASGWFLARRPSRAPVASRSYRGVPPDYFRGLDYLTNDQPDKAIEVLSRMLEADAGTVDAHISLGNLFRRRGEVDRAIRLHQGVVGRAELSPDLRRRAQLELGHDYLRAGLLDRAEHLLQGLVEDPDYGESALRYLVTVYQLEREWESAAETALRLQNRSGENMTPTIAHYLCELAEEAARKREPDAAKAYLGRALVTDPQCVRASLLEARWAREEGRLEAGIAALRRAAAQDPGYLNHILPTLGDLYHRLGRVDELLKFLEDVMRRQPCLRAALMSSELIERQHGRQDAAIFIANFLSGSPSLRGLGRLVDLTVTDSSGELRDTLRVIQGTLERITERVPLYKCQKCGFGGRALHWQCPSCKSWGSVRPVATLVAEITG